MERISGPFNGFYIVTYASSTGGPGVNYLGYSKICRGRPDNYWGAHSCANVVGMQIHTSAHAAMDEAEKHARDQTGTFASIAFAKPAPGGQRIAVRT